MKKLGILLDETTIINFPHLWKLLRRYGFLAIIVPLIAIGYGGKQYIEQNNIFMLQKSFVYSSADAGGGGGAMAIMARMGGGDEGEGMSPGEVTSLVQNLDFLQSFAEKLYVHPQLNRMIFTGLNGKEVVTSRILFSSCGESKECKIKVLRNTVAGFISIKMDPALSKKYWVEVKTLDSFTTRELISLVVEEIVRTRRVTQKRKMNEQIKVTEGLIEKKRKELNGIDVYALKQKKKELEDELDQITNKMNSYGREYQNKNIQLSYMESKLKKTKETAEKDINISEKDKITKRVLIQSRIEKVRKDIDAIKILSDQIGEKDKAILAQLEKKKRQLETELKKIGLGARSAGYTMEFLDQKDKEKEVTEFDYQVLSKQVIKINREYKKYEAMKKEVTQEIIKINNTFEQIAPILESIKLLEAKAAQLRLVETTVVSDLIFDIEMGGMRVYKKASVVKIVLFSITLSLFLLFLGILLRYLIDDRILDEAELEKTFDGITIIGSTPDFD